MTATELVPTDVQQAADLFRILAFLERKFVPAVAAECTCCWKIPVDPAIRVTAYSAEHLITIQIEDAWKGAYSGRLKPVACPKGLPNSSYVPGWRIWRFMTTTETGRPNGMYTDWKTLTLVVNRYITRYVDTDDGRLDDSDDPG